MTWVETASAHFVARHADADTDGALDVLQLLEDTRARLEEELPAVPGVEIATVLHSTVVQLHLAQPILPVVSRLTSPAARRYLAGWFARDTVHVLAPSALDDRASGVPGSKEMLRLTPAALYTRLALAASNPALPPPFRLRRTLHELRWAWLTAGFSQWFSGQTAQARPAIARRLREGPPPAFPPRLRDAHLLGGTLVDLLVREEGRMAAVRLATELAGGEVGEALEAAFHGRGLRHTEGAWRLHLSKLAGRAPA